MGLVSTNSLASVQVGVDTRVELVQDVALVRASSVWSWAWKVGLGGWGGTSVRGGGMAFVIDHWDLAESVSASMVTVRVNAWIHLVGSVRVVWTSVCGAVSVVSGGGGALVGMGSGAKDAGRFFVVTGRGSGLRLITQDVGVSLALRQVGVIRWASSVSTSVLIGFHARIQLVGELRVVWASILRTSVVLGGGSQGTAGSSTVSAMSPTSISIRVDTRIHLIGNVGVVWTGIGRGVVMSSTSISV